MLFVILGALAGLGGVGYLSFKLFFPWIKYDLAYLKAFSPFGKAVQDFEKKGTLYIDMFEETAKRFSKKAMILFEEQQYSFEEINSRANQVGNAAVKLGLRQGDTVALLFLNKPAYIWTYLGFLKIGVQVALINYNLRLNSLVNSIKASQAKILVVGTGEDLQEAVLKIIDDIDDVRVYTNDGKIPYLYDKISSFTDLVETASDQTPDRKLRSDVTIKSTCFLIYTSGTTGLPKPAIVTQLKSILFAHFFVLYGVGSEEIIYEPLPLYHTAGSMLGIGFAIAKDG